MTAEELIAKLSRVDGETELCIHILEESDELDEEPMPVLISDFRALADHGRVLLAEHPIEGLEEL